MRATILGWSALSGLVLGLMAGLTAFAVLVLGGELAAAVMPRMIAHSSIQADVWADWQALEHSGDCHGSGRAGASWDS